MADKIVDLHIHTNYSDGVLTPEQILAKAVESGLSAISITDHDTIDGYIIAETKLDQYDIELISGVEFSSYENSKEFHILGYAVDPDYKPLQKHLALFKQSREKRARKIAAKLKTLNVELDFNKIIEKADEAPITRPHIASVIQDSGFVSSSKEAFIRFIGDYGPAYVDKDHFPVEQCIDLINKSGGVASLAHPGNSITQATLYKMIQYGLDGIEVVHPSHNDEMQKYYHSIASQYWLLGTGGSDYHGYKEYDEDNFGRSVVPYSVVQSLHLHTGN